MCLGWIVSSSCEFEEINYREPIPSVLPPSEVTSSGFSAAWIAIEGSEKYVLSVSDEQNFDDNKSLPGFPLTISGTSYQVTGLEADTEYYYRVKINAVKAEYSVVMTVTTLPLLAPQIHYPKQITPLSFIAQWLSVEGADAYQLYVSEDANFITHIEGYNGKLVEDTTAIIGGLTVDKNYFYRVRTVRGASVSVVSELMTVNTSTLSQPVLTVPSDTSFTSVTINWKAVEGATSYRLYVATDPLVITDVLPEYDGRIVEGATSLIVTGINANTTYYYRVQALNEQSASEVSEVGTINTTNLPVPTARPATNVRINGFQANWDSVANSSSYVLDVSRNESFTNYVTGYQAKEIIDTSEVINGLLRNTNYFYRVRSKGFGAVSANSNVIRVTTSSFASPRALEAVELQPTSFKAVWQQVAGADSYRLEVATDANFENNLPSYDNVPVADTVQQVTGLVVNRRYFYRVRALKGGVFSGYSNIIDLTTTTLSVPQNLTVSNQQLQQFTINWNVVTGATRYRVDVGFDPLLENKISVDYDNRIVNAPATSLVVEGLEPNRTYYFRVRAENAVSTGESATGSGKTAPIDPPTASLATNIQITSFQANWQIAANAESYLVDVALNVGFTDLVAGYNGREVVDPSHMLVVNGLEPGQTYYYRVRSRGLGVTSDYSSTITVMTAALPAPVVQAATNQEVYQFTANWQEVPEANSYLLDVATDLAFTNVLSAYNSKPVLGSAHNVTGLNPYTTYHYRLRSKQGSVVSGFSNPVATVNAVVGSGCAITERDFGSLGEETYTYASVGGPLTAINFIGGSTSRTSQIVYDDTLIDEVTIDDSDDTKDQTWKYIYETYNGTENRIKEISIEDNTGTEIKRIHFSYSNATSDRVSIVRYRTLPSNAIEKRSSYTYSATQITVSDSSSTSNGVVKRLTLENSFHTESLLPSDVALLLYNPTEPGESWLPFIPEQRPTYYEYDLQGTPEVYTYPYANISKGIPKRILANGGVPQINYTFSGSCNF
jgi:phosphodiesterase/alkaline phosphatase D-like protein